MESLDLYASTFKTKHINFQNKAFIQIYWKMKQNVVSENSEKPQE